MTERVLGPTGSPRRRRTLFLPLIAVLAVALSFVAGAQAVHDDGLFELDKNATNNLNTTNIGILQANISSTDDPIVVCEKSPAPAGTPAATPFTILVEAEQMTVTARAAIAGGAGGCSTKASYTVTRGSNNAAHQKADDVTLMQSATKDGPDWNLVHQEVTADANDTGNDDKCVAIGLLECSYVNDGAGATIFDQGGSKDHEIIANWKHKSGAVSDKSDILNAYAAKDVDGSGRQILYFGADRQAVDGSTDAGFWFFRNEVIANPDGTFTGTHSGSLQSPGDILILTTFTQGGAANNVRVFRWVGSGGNESGSIQGPDATFADCVPGGANDNGCATVNDSSILVPWAHQSKGEPVGGWVPAGGLLEGGVDLTGLGLDGCFSSFLAETRSSPSVPAILEDFVLGKFEACGSSLTTTPKQSDGTTNLAADTDGDNLREISIGTGSVQVKDSAVLDVTGISSFTGTLSFRICGPIASGACNTGGVLSGSSTVTTNGTYTSSAATLTSVGRYCWYAEFDSGTQGVPDATDATTESAGPPSSTGECFEVKPVTPGLDTAAVTSPVDFGQAVQDNATLSGTATQPGTAGANTTYPSINSAVGAAAGGKITFTLLKANCTDLATGTGTNPQDFTPISGNATYGPVSFTPDAPGTYHWKAQYVPATGDPNNIGSTHNATCNDTDETVVVNQVPTAMTTRQFVFPQDKVAITVATGTLAGNARFTLHDDLTECQGRTDIKYDSGNIAISGASGQTATTNNTTYRIVNGTTHYWNVSYASTNPAHLGSSSVCTETTAVTYAGNDTNISIP